VTLPGRWPRGFAGQRYRIEDYDLKHFTKVTIDINRRDSVIIRDFKLVLEELRREVSAPAKVMPRIRDWLANHILAVWDLRQYNVSWFDIATVLGLGRPGESRAGAVQTARNSHETAKLYIEEGKWQSLARYIETS
jgi:hypothetical protein